MVATRTVEAMPILVSSSLGLLYTLFLSGTRDVVLIVIFVLLVVRSGAAMVRPRTREKIEGEE
ncbi:MAG: hypothetical protein ONB14_02810 [candidate division KSB1 bacterium]|nr:hypothetical protein [candidate division KSB1 bacterium]